GQVYEATDASGSAAAVKFVRKVPGAERELLFVDLPGVRNVIPVIDSGETADSWVIVMPKAQGSLRNRLNDALGPLPLTETVKVLTEVAETLEDLQGRIAHRDLKPDNVLYLDGKWCLADFGISRYAEATTVANTFKGAWTRAYAAPERWLNERATSAADIYALAVSGYELLTGRLPFDGPDLQHDHLYTAPPDLPAGVPESLAAVLRQGMAKNPAARPDATAMLTVLRQVKEPLSFTGYPKLGRQPGVEGVEGVALGMAALHLGEGVPTGPVPTAPLWSGEMGSPPVVSVGEQVGAKSGSGPVLSGEGGGVAGPLPGAGVGVPGGGARGFGTGEDLGETSWWDRRRQDWGTAGVESEVGRASVEVVRSLVGGAVDQATEIARGIGEPSARSRALGLVSAALTAVDPQMAGELLEEAETAAVGIGDPLARAWTLTAVAGTASTVGSADGGLAARLLTAAETAAAGIDDRTARARTLTVVAEAMSGSDPHRAGGLLLQAEALATGLPDGQSKALTLTGIAATVTNAMSDRAGTHGRVERLLSQAAGMASAIIDPVSKAQTLAAVAQVVSVGDRGRAIGLLAEAAGVGLALPDGPDRARTLIQLAQATAPVDAVDATDLYHQARHAATDLVDPGTRARALTYLAWTAAPIDPGRASRALSQVQSAAAEINDAANRAQVLAAAAATMALNDPAGARQLLATAVHLTGKNTAPGSVDEHAAAGWVDKGVVGVERVPAAGRGGGRPAAGQRVERPRYEKTVRNLLSVLQDAQTSWWEEAVRG
ncbi:MAG TPA: serine/threonine-protein kinase, partial [Kineosporiaceae bacterium]|nr:serine/threonine-protein kinase [Kineosporiaceae bacterium]